MTIRPIRTDADLDRALERIDDLWDATEGTPEFDELDVLAVLIEAYEAQHHAIPPGDPLDIIRFKMKELDLSQRALTERMGWTSTGRLSEILSGKRELTTRHVRDLAAALGIQAGLLLGDSSGRTASQSTRLDLSDDLVDDIQQVARSLDLSPQAYLRQVVAMQRQACGQINAGPRPVGSRASAVNNGSHFKLAA